MQKNILFMIIWCIGVFQWMPAGAQSLPESLRETLKDIKPAVGVCRADAKEDNVRAGIPEVVIPFDPSCTVSADQVADMLQKPDAVLIDVRAQNIFERSHLPGALNMSIAELKRKKFLASRRVILVGMGKGDSELNEACRELRKVGFNQTIVLRGGMISWASAKYPVAGQPINPLAEMVLSPAELFVETKQPGNLVLATPSSKSIAKMLDAATMLGNGSLMTEVKNAVAKRRKAGPINKIVLIVGEEFNRNSLPDLINVAKSDPLLVYMDSARAYQQFTRTQIAMWNKMAKGPKQPGCSAM
jgi:rhodanese-related sulfurtransferase